ncbi:CopG family transcriptional regulator [Halobacteriales archaeon QS_9_67_17]|nr:MAG: CopG family transcriptional regulator [Halobacteriales archaeon QS_9_67_17]
MRRFEFVAPTSTARDIERLAREYGLTEQEVVEQLVELGMQELDDASRENIRSGGDPRP